MKIPEGALGKEQPEQLKTMWAQEHKELLDHIQAKFEKYTVMEPCEGIPNTTINCGSGLGDRVVTWRPHGH